jgi:hypothetical protein
MRKLLCFVAALLVLAIPVLAIESVTVLWSVADDTIRPGGQTTVQLTFNNPTATDTPQYINMAVSPGPYLIIPPTSATIATLAPGASQQTTLNVKVAPDAVSTNSYLTVKVTYAVNSLTRDTVISIPIKIRRIPILEIDNVSFSNPPEPGATTTLSFYMFNSGQGPAEELKVSMGQGTNFISTGSAGETVIQQLGASESRRLDFPLTINPKAESGIYSIPFTLSYYDETKSNLTITTKSIGLTIGGQAQFVINLDSTKEFYFGRKGTASVSISNNGNAPADFLTVKASSKFGTKEVYVGTLDPDDTETVDVEQTLTGVTGPYKLNIELAWKDKFGAPHTETRELELSPTSAPIEISPALILLILVVGGAVWWFRRRKAK